ncbi:MAG TPA: TetR/AcrR family transcriptional regulator [Rhizomicrobium sp.]|nr:TetR/AcrR family transcriptional regulator [Rhizomicrobium sp.]
MARKSRYRSADTVARVLKAARQTLIRDGYAQLSTRRVAARAGISVGNLTYHFPGKQSLLRALVQSLVEDYGAQIERILTDVSNKGPERLEALVDWLVRDAASTPTMRLFRELWVMALHDKAAARAVDDFYDAAMARASELLKAARPELSGSERDKLILLCAMISEGSSVLFGTRRKRKISSAEMASFAARLVKAQLSP